MIEKLKKYFKETPREKVLENWAKSDEFDKIGPTMDEFLEQHKSTQTLLCIKKHSQTIPKTKISIFKTAFIQVFLVAVNTIFLAKGILMGIAITSFLISWLWVANVKKANIASKYDRLIYATGAMVGAVLGYLFTNLIIKQ